MIAVLVAAGVGLGSKNYWSPTRPANIPPGPNTEATHPPEPFLPPDPQFADEEPRLVTAEERATIARQPIIVQPVARSIPGPASQPGPEPSPYTRQLVSSLAHFNPTGEGVSPEEAAQWKQSLQTLTAQGAAAVPAIEEFLDRNQEVNLRSSGNAEILGQTSLRSSFISALGQISGPEATAALVQTLQSTTLPTEIAQLSQVLEKRAPGEYRQETLNAITEVLNMASTGQLSIGWDVGDLFKTLQTYGDASSASALEQLQGSYKYYATLALAGLQGGEGISVLSREARDSSAGGRRDFALQMLAQSAAQFPDAAATLLEQAKANQIPDSAWSKIALGLAGDQYQIGQPSSSGRGAADLIKGLKTYHIGTGNQNFYSVPLGPGAQIQQRLALLDQFLGAASNPAAQSILQSARASLNSLLTP
jgi:hypothetical protein